MSSNKNNDLIDQELVRQLADLLTETELTEIEIERQGVRLKIARQAPQVSHHLPVPAPQPAPAVEPSAPQPVALEDHPGLVRSPMVGTVYLAPRPGAQSFAQEGDLVTEGQTLLIVEAMKVMNNIQAPRSGKITRILVQNEQPIEFDEPLMIIE